MGPASSIANPLAKGTYSTEVDIQYTASDEPMRQTRMPIASQR
jgi:hypothetical protein